MWVGIQVGGIQYPGPLPSSRPSIGLEPFAKSHLYMFNLLQLRFRNTIADIQDKLYEISLEPRLMPNSLDVLQRDTRSNVSTPTLRPRDGTVTPFVPKDPGANVRVVVRVRAFLPRGMRKIRLSININGHSHANTCTYHRTRAQC